MKKLLLTMAALALISTGASANLLSDYRSGKIVRATCPADKPLMDDKGYCHSCYELGSVEISPADDLFEMCHTADGKPIREEERETFSIFTYLITCPEEAPLKTGAGCTKCDDPAALSVKEEECLKCNKDGQNVRVFVKVGDYGYGCRLADCTGKPLKDRDGGCYPCDFEGEIWVPNGTCTKTCPNRTETGGQTRYRDSGWSEECALKKETPSESQNPCPPDKPILDETGNCRACDFYRKEIKAVLGCDKCANRYGSGFWASSEAGAGTNCILKGE